MPADVATVVLKGLAEGLTLHTAEREPTDAEGLMDRFERLLDRRPHANRIESVLRELKQADLVRTETENDAGAYRLTQQGARRLEAYRRLPEAFKASLVELFCIQPASMDASPPSPVRGRGAPSIPSEGWIAAALEQIPREVEVQAPYARVGFDRDPGGRAWTLRVERHEPGRYEGAEACPLTFLYEAATQLLSHARGPSMPSPRTARER